MTIGIDRAKTLRLHSAALGFLLMGGLMLMTGAASARQEILRWTHPAPADIVRFEALVGTSSQNYNAPISLGKPTPDGSGIYTASITVADSANVYVALQAVDTAGATSFPSNERLRLAAPSTSPPAPEPEPPADPPADPGPGLAGGTELQANPNATLRADFDSGSATNWLDTAANNSLTVDDRLFSVAVVGGNPALSTDSTATNIHSHFVGNPSNLGTIVFTGHMAGTSSASGFGVTAYSQFPSADTYYRLRTIGNGETFELGGHPQACSGDSDTGVVPQANVWYEFEMTVSSEAGGNRITASIWPQGGSKPSSPQASCLDGAGGRPSGGTIGVWSMGSGTKYWDDLEVTSGSLSGPTIPAGPPPAPFLIDITPI